MSHAMHNREVFNMMFIKPYSLEKLTFHVCVCEKECVCVCVCVRVHMFACMCAC